MTESLVVILGDAVAGTLIRARGGAHRFDYDESYRRRDDATPLSVSMRTQVRSHYDESVTPWLWGLLPDNEAVLTRWARQFQASASSPFSLLATPIGHDCAGAVRFAVPEQANDLLQRPGQVDWLSEADMAQRLRDLKADSTAWLGRSFTGQFSLAGAQAKMALLQRDGRWGEPSGSMATSHILKPAVAGLDDHDLNEHICLDAARRSGLLVAHTQVARFENESAIVVQRYDRRDIDGQMARIHQEDLCQAMSISPSNKYQNAGGPSPKQVATLFREAMPAPAADAAIARFLDALAWNWLIAGTDAHAKNYSLLLASGQIRLAPLYDVASALPYGAQEQKLRFAMKMGRDYLVAPRTDPWPAVAAALRLTSDAVTARVRELAARAPDALADAARAPEVAALGRPMPDRLVKLVAARVLRLQTLLN